MDARNKQRILDVLELAESNGLTAQDIHRYLGNHELSKAEVNRILYKQLLEGKVKMLHPSETPPRWRRVVVEEEESAPVEVPNQRQGQEVKTIVMIDLGNVHDSLSQIKPYAKRNRDATNISVLAFADYAYKLPPAGAGEEQGYDVEVLQVKEPCKNAADLLLVFTCFQLCGGR